MVNPVYEGGLNPDWEWWDDTECEYIHQCYQKQGLILL